MDPATISAVAELPLKIAETVAKIGDMKKRRETEAALNSLTAKQQYELNVMLANAQTDTDRMQILSSAVVQFAIANESAAGKSNTTMYFIAAGLAVALMVMAIFLIKEDKK